MDASPDQYLQTEYVFIDTQAFQQAKFDWKGRVLSKLAQFALDGHLRILITDITKREVKCHLQEQLADAAHITRKHACLLEQLGVGNVISILTDPKAPEKLEAEFEAFLEATKAIDVPVIATLDEVFSDYFARRPPFSEKKKAEFPDAVVIASLRAWCLKRKAKAYVVSGDQDLKACCASLGPLIYAASVEEVVSQATVSKEVHDALQRTLFESEALSDSLATKLLRLTVVRGDLRLRSLTGTVEDVGDINIYSVNVLERDGLTFTCEVEFEARLTLSLNVEDEGRTEFGYEIYEPRFRRKTRDIYRQFVAEVVVIFDSRKLDETAFESVYVHRHEIELDIDDLMAR